MAPARDNAARKQGLEATDLQPDAKIKHSAWESLGKCGVGADAHQQGVQPTLAHNLELRGFRTPSPIQRASIPPALSKPGRDVLGMARTGSGKTLAYLIPVLQRLGRERRVFHGARALILCPNRELALQILKAGKDIARGARLSGIEDKCLKWVLLIGGDPMERQFAELSSSPDM